MDLRRTFWQIKMVLAATGSSMLLATRAAIRGAGRSPSSYTLRNPSATSMLWHHRVQSLTKKPLRMQSSIPKVCAYDRVLLASMGLVGGGVAVTGLFGGVEEWTESLHRSFYRNDDDSVSGQVKMAFGDMRRRMEAELHDDNKKVLAGLIASNVAVWGVWRVSFRIPRLERFMWRHFACSYNAVVHGKRFHTLLTAAFSHITIPHIAINMFMLWEFGSHIIAPIDAMDSWLEKALARSRTVDFLKSSISNAAQPELLPLEEFLTLYASSAVTSSVLSIIASRFRATQGVFTIGASGAVMGVLTMYCLLFPERRMMLYGLFELTATQLLQLMTAVNIVGSAFQKGLHIDFTGHLGGQLMGLALHEAKPQLA